ncbi:hypothetical protein WH47_04719 [Habropoda laboriosa]|uniref:CCHC-type domain-containing protein n=1 Tax=Habropoda laboriosa TaxID=597456 RepID=A0A0L7QJD2_9HYME|nr:hypothetical protein WH47_04719 [Habropoda laboriosa]
MRTTFGPLKNAEQYRGALAGTYQYPGEHIIDFISRVKDLRSAILDCERSTHIVDKTGVDEFTLQCFCDGLIPEIRLQLTVSRTLTLSEAFARARELYRRFELDRERQSSTPKTTNRSSDVDQTQRRAARPPPPPAETKSCRYCKGLGHTIDECRKRQFNNSIRERYGEPRRIDDRERRAPSSRENFPRYDHRDERRITEVRDNREYRRPTESRDNREYRRVPESRDNREYRYREDQGNGRGLSPRREARREAVPSKVHVIAPATEENSELPPSN